MEKATRVMPGKVPVTLTDISISTSPLTTLPELGAVKHKVTLYPPDGGVLVAQVLVGIGVGVGVGIGVGVGVAVGVGLGVGFPFEYTGVVDTKEIRIKITIKNGKMRFNLIMFFLLEYNRG